MESSCHAKPQRKASFFQNVGCLARIVAELRYSKPNLGFDRSRISCVSKAQAVPWRFGCLLRFRDQGGKWAIVRRCLSFVKGAAREKQPPGGVT